MTKVPEPIIPPEIEEPFAGDLPHSTGGLPHGLANSSAQGCNGCHYQTHDDWQNSGHARSAAFSERFQAAIQEANPTQCTLCHLPLIEQQSELTVFAGDDDNHPETKQNPAYNATLQTEGVTCAACHIRKETVIAARYTPNAPHATGWSAQLGQSQSCASCHQLSWPGAQTPFYDTYGEWTRSGYAQAGIQCQNCHMAGGADGGTASHTMNISAERAVSLLVTLERPTLTRGGDPISVAIRLQNTGAGHAYPTGHPDHGVRLYVALEGPNASTDEKAPPRAIWGEPFTADLARTLGSEPPWQTLADTRLGAGGERTFATTLALSLDAPPAPWTLVVSLLETWQGRPAAKPIVVQRIDLMVD